MLGFLKKLFGLPTQEEIARARESRVEVPVVNNKTGDVVEPAVTAVVETQVTDSVTAEVAPVKKTRKPRVKKADSDSKPAKAVAKKSTSRSKKV